MVRHENMTRENPRQIACREKKEHLQIALSIAALVFSFGFLSLVLRMRRAAFRQAAALRLQALPHATAMSYPAPPPSPGAMRPRGLMEKASVSGTGNGGSSPPEGTHIIFPRRYVVLLHSKEGKHYSMRNISYEACIVPTYWVFPSLLYTITLDSDYYFVPCI